ncbi:MAG TPA: ABC transporter permease [Actinomycetes bacterium]|nr:ABC transporter permease [Actinomycetes bacterium]
MGKYILRRLLQMILVLIGASLILFVCLFVLPGDPIGSLAGSERVRDPVVRETLEKRYNLDKPLPVQYLTYLGNVATGDLGESFRLRRPVNDVIWEKIGNTFRLALTAIVFEIIIGVIAGIVAAVFRYSFWDVLVTVAVTLTVGFATFVTGLILQQVFALKLGWLPLSGQETPLHYILPAVTLASVSTALVARLMRGTMLEVLRADYIRTAFAKGLTKRTVILKHALRNSVIPVVTFIGIDFGTLLGGALITEVIFNWNGIGSALVTAIGAQDNPMVLGIATYSVAIFVVVNLVVDTLYGFLDPRIRLQ